MYKWVLFTVDHAQKHKCCGGYLSANRVNIFYQVNCILY
jgi:hypothetical protein